ncbi:hypothetical protein AUR64_04005 [Haloprofundus marisrubri]|uniref:Uncharacterized protein n=1 Tax=Haloprofundus marisrubri TaxID=1514971 RepID=A0A0W1RDE6_9EURY|nr:hypothetical protein [Haloprofundus marisrubri]KTG11426.1 hypothetical protein AUR64_04005 [Haloprofundus marisrubri]
MNQDRQDSISETLQVESHKGSDSLPWQFSIVRTPEKIVIEEARGPKDRFDPVVKDFTIERRELHSPPLTFEHAVSRHVWQEDEDQPAVRSQRSQGHIIEVLYETSDGWHLDRPEPMTDGPLPETNGEVVPTRHTGISVEATFLRSEDGTDLKFTEEREYHITEDVFSEYETVYVLSYNEVNEESTDNLEWTVEDAIAFELVPDVSIN